MYQSPIYEKYLKSQDKKSKARYMKPYMKPYTKPSKPVNLHSVLADEQSIVSQDINADIDAMTRDGWFRDLFKRKKHNKNNDQGIVENLEIDGEISNEINSENEATRLNTINENVKDNVEDIADISTNNSSENSIEVDGEISNEINSEYEDTRLNTINDSAKVTDKFNNKFNIYDELAKINEANDKSNSDFDNDANNINTPMSRDGILDWFRRKKHNKNPNPEEVRNVVNDIVDNDNDEIDVENEEFNIPNNNDRDSEDYLLEESSEIISSDTPFQDMNEVNQSEDSDSDFQALLNKLNKTNSEDFGLQESKSQSRPVLKSGSSRYIKNLRKYYD